MSDKTIKADVPRYRIRTGYDVIAERWFAEVISGGSLVKTFFTRELGKAERQARSYIALAERGHA